MVTLTCSGLIDAENIVQASHSVRITLVDKTKSPIIKLDTDNMVISSPILKVTDSSGDLIIDLWPGAFYLIEYGIDYKYEYLIYLASDITTATLQEGLLAVENLT